VVPAARRQQKDRTAATRAAVLEATVELLVERGYSGTSTRLAAERAGVSLGALQHHFPTKAGLSVEALRFVTARLASEFVASTRESQDAQDTFAAILDRLYVVFRGPTFAAAVEIHLASRTDEALQGPVRDLNRDIDTLIRESAESLMPGMAGYPGFPSILQTSVSAVRGLALTAMDPAADREEEWQMVRTHLLELADRMIAEGAA
jgi:AcrR family transcriptional regulator